MVLIIGGAYQGKTEYVKEHFDSGYEIVNHYHLKVKEQLKKGQNCFLEAEKLLSEKEHLIIITDEIGYGLVPMEEEERVYREIAGRVNCYLAKEADEVIRVVCGIGNRIK